MGRVKNEILKEESGSPRPASPEHGATWVPNGRAAATPTMPELAASVEARPTSHRTTSQFISAKRQQGAEPPTQEASDHHTGSAPDEQRRTSSSDPYAHLRNQPRQEREPPIAPVPAYEAYEVVATPVVDKDDNDGTGNKNPLKDWRVWVAILVVAALVGLSVGLVMSKNQSAAAPAESTSGLPNGVPEPPTLPPADNGETEAPAPSPEEPGEVPATPPGSEESRLSDCSKDGGPAVLLNEFSVMLVTQDEVDLQVLITSVKDHLWSELQPMQNVKGFTIAANPTRRLLQGLRHLQTTTKLLFQGCIILHGETPVPTYEEVQAAINSSFSGSNLEIWISSASEQGMEISSVAVFDASGAQIGSA